MVSTSDGFEIANLDLQLRGPGELDGTRQSGILDFKIADIVKDEKILVEARNAAIEIIEKDPQLVNPENQRISRTLVEMLKSKGNWSQIS